MRARENRPRSSSRNAPGSVIAAPRSSAGGSACAGAQHATSSNGNKNRKLGLIPELTPPHDAYSSASRDWLEPENSRKAAAIFAIAFRAKHALGLDPGVDAGSRKENASK